MDEIVRGLFQSSHPEHVKKKIFKKLRLSASKGVGKLAVDQQQNILNVCISYYLHGNLCDHQEALWLLQDFVPLCESGCYQMFDNKFFENVVVGKFVPNKFSSLYLKVLPSSSIAISRRATLIEILLKEFYHRKMTKLVVYIQVCIKTEVIRLLYDSLDHATFAQLCSFLKRYEECMPPSSRRFALCTISIRAMSEFFPLNNDINDLSSYIKDINEISSFVNYIWLKEPATVDPSLVEVFNLISSQSSSQEPSNALGCLVPYIPQHIINVAVAQIVNNTNVSDVSMTTALARMVAWLGWPNATQAHLWVLAFLHELARASKFSILVDVTVKTIKQVFNCLLFPVTRASAMQVLIHMLMSHQDSDDAFRIIVPLLPQMISKIENEHNREKNEVFLNQLANLCHCMMRLHSGFPELYSPILEALKNYPVPSLRATETALKYSSWLPAHAHVVCEGEMLSRREAGGKAGLTNLGNTCYINSVVQALFMVDEFRCAMLKQTTSPSSVSGCLSKTFAYLLLTERTSYKPSDLVESSRPPWFHPGAQQDCTEYMKHLLEQLEKEEKKMAFDKPRDELATGSMEGDLMADGSSKKLLTVVERLFQGKIESNIKCTRCNVTSSREEDFTDFALPLLELPKRGGVKSPPSSDQPPPTDLSSQVEEGVKRQHRLEDLLHTAFADELLEGENQYRCNRCSSLTDAVKSVRVTILPRHLLLTLLRTTFNPERQVRSKLMDIVDVPEEIQVPLYEGGTTRLVGYGLVAIVVHSGLSTDSGHYYSYARQGGAWYLFNDGHVSPTSFGSISRSPVRFERDTPYVLVFTRQDVTMTTVESGQTLIRQSFRDVIDDDNRRFRKEIEEASKRPTRRSFSNVLGWRDDDNPPPPPSCGGGSNGPIPFNRFVF